MSVTYVFQLFISNGSPASMRAQQNAERLCQELGPEHCRLEVINVRDHPQKAEKARVLAVPTLIKIAPLPLLRVIGDLSNRPRILSALGWQPSESRHQATEMSDSSLKSGS